MNRNSQSSLFQNELPPDIKLRFDSLCLSPSAISISQLVTQIGVHIQEIEEALEVNEFLDVQTASRVAEMLIDLINQLNKYSTKEQKLIIGAAQYFVSIKKNVDTLYYCVGIDGTSIF